MFDKLNSAEQVEGAESVVKVRLKKKKSIIFYIFITVQYFVEIA